MSKKVPLEMTMNAVSLALRGAWVVAMIIVLMWWLSGHMSDPPELTLSSERGLLGLITLVALTFPLGFAWALALNLAAYLMESTSLAAPVSDVWLAFPVWMGFFVAGYVQWFVLLPWLWRKWKARQAGEPTSSV